MRFAEPIAWIFASLAVVLIYLYWRPRHRRPVIVPALFLWPELPPRRQRQWDPLLLLQIAALCSLVAALAAPYRELPTPAKPQQHVLVVDRTASMQATDERGSRLEAAKSAARKYLGNVAPGDRVAVVAVGEQAEVIIPFSTDLARVAEAIAALEAYDSPGSLAQGLALARTLAQAAGDDARVAVFSDFADGDVPPSLLSNVQMFPVGRGDRNLGITAVTLSGRSWQSVADSELVVRVRNYGSQPEHGLLVVEWQDRPLLRKGLTLPPHEGDAVTIPQLPGPGVVSVKLVADDLLATDNEATLWIAEPEPLRMCVIAAQQEPWPELQALVRAVPAITLEGKDCATGGTGASVFLFHRARPPDGVRVPVLVVDPPPKSPTHQGRAFRDVPVVAWDAQQPIFANWTPAFPLPLKAVREIEPPEGAVPVLWGGTAEETVPLAWIAEHPARQVWLAFDMARESSLTADGFPLAVFLLESLAWLRPAPPSPPAWDAGKPYPLSLGTPAVVRLPNGAEQPIEGTSFLPHWRGRYEVRGPNGEQSFFVVATDGREGDIAPKLSVTSAPPPESLEPASTRVSLVQAVLAAALVLLLAEAWVAARSARGGEA